MKMITFHGRCICDYIKIFKTDPFTRKSFILRLNFFTTSIIFVKFPLPKKPISWILGHTPKLMSVCVSVETRV